VKVLVTSALITGALGNPIPVVTSGVERLAGKAPFGSGKWGSSIGSSGDASTRANFPLLFVRFWRCQ
jgi:hypothetical protein